MPKGSMNFVTRRKSTPPQSNSNDLMQLCAQNELRCHLECMNLRRETLEEKKKKLARCCKIRALLNISLMSSTLKRYLQRSRHEQRFHLLVLQLTHFYYKTS